MRFLGMLVVSSAIVLGACSGGGEKAADTGTAAAKPDTAAAPAPAPAAAAPTGAMAPITGQTHEVKMVGDDKGYRFEPADITVKAGDGIKFTMVSGGPHNVAFDPATVPADVKSQLSANMGPNQMGELSGPLLSNANESYTISFANVKPGQYPYHCTPHLAMGMKGTITVQ
jgi:plastocyanin